MWQCNGNLYKRCNNIVLREFISIRIRHVAIFYQMLSTECYLVYIVRIAFSVWLVSGYGHVYLYYAFRCHCHTVLCALIVRHVRVLQFQSPSLRRLIAALTTASPCDRQRHGRQGDAKCQNVIKNQHHLPVRATVTQINCYRRIVLIMWTDVCHAELRVRRSIQTGVIFKWKNTC